MVRFVVGNEMRVAYQEAMKLGIPTVLIDRPVEVCTLQVLQEEQTRTFYLLNALFALAYNSPPIHTRTR